MGFLKALKTCIEKWYVALSVVPKVDPNRTNFLPIAPDYPQPEGGKVPFDHSVWDDLLKAHVTRGRLDVYDGLELNLLDYTSLSTDSRFEAYLTSLSGAKDIDSWNANDQIAYYINLYNAYCINLIVTRLKTTGALPVSINDLSLNASKTPVWDLPAGKLQGKDTTLNTIEHKILRTKFKEPRVHSSIVCASASCPDLRAGAFNGWEVNVQMNEQCKQWLENEKKGSKVSSKKLTLSRIFLWFTSDFEAVSGTVEKFVGGHAVSNGVKGFVEGGGKVDVDYFEYSWFLNNKA